MKRIIYALLLMMIVPMVYADISDNIDLRYEEFGMDKFNSKMANVHPLINDDGYVVGDSFPLLDNGEIETNLYNEMDDYRPLSCHFTSPYIGATSSADLLITNGTKLKVYEPFIGDGGISIEFPNRRGGMTCGDFDGDGYDEVMGVNFQNGETVAQVFGYNPVTDAIEQQSVNVLDQYGITFTGDISCNDDTGSSEWRCFLQGWETDDDPTSTVMALALNDGESNFYIASNLTLFANQTLTFNAHNNWLGHGITAGNEIRLYPFWGDRAYQLRYFLGAEAFQLDNFYDSSYSAFDKIVDVLPFNNYKRGSLLTGGTINYDANVGVIIKVGADLYFEMRDASLQTLVNGTAITNVADCSRLSDNFEEKAFLYDLYGDFYKDIMIGAYRASNLPGGLRYHNCLAVVNVNFNGTDYSLSYQDETDLGGYVDVISPQTLATQYGNALRIEDYQILDFGNDGDNELYVIPSNKGVGGMFTTTYINPRYYGLEGDFGSFYTISGLSANKFAGNFFSDFTGDTRLDLFSVYDAEIVQHNSGDPVNFTPSFTYSGNNGCGNNAGNEDNSCSVDVNTTVTYTVTAIDPEGDGMNIAYDCDIDDLQGIGATGFVPYNATNAVFNCSYNTRKTLNTRVWVTDTLNYENSKDTRVQVTGVGGLICVNNDICEFGAGESIDNCPVDCFQCNDGVDNDFDNLTDFPLDTGCLAEFDNTENTTALPECQDEFDNDGDGLIDYPNDLGCDSYADTNEGDDPAQCLDGIDNDGDGFIDFPEDPGCNSASDVLESDNPECSDGVDNDNDGKIDLSDSSCGDVYGDDESGDLNTLYYTTDLSWWSQYQYRSDNIGTTSYGSDSILYWGNNFDITNHSMPTQTRWQPLVADYDGDNQNEVMSWEQFTVTVYDYQMNVEKELSATQFNISDVPDAQPVLHFVSPIQFIVYYYNQVLYSARYDGDSVSVISMTDTIPESITQSGIACKPGTLTCYMVTDDNDVIEFNIGNGNYTLYPSGGALTHTNTLYRELALTDLDTVDDLELIFSVYDPSSDEGGVVVYDTQSHTLDTSFSGDGVSMWCPFSFLYPDLGFVISDPMVVQVDSGSFEIVQVCGAMEDLTPYAFARAQMIALSATGNTKWQDDLLDDGNLLTSSYMNSSISDTKILLVDQPVLVNTGISLLDQAICTRVYQEFSTPGKIRQEFACNYLVNGSRASGVVCDDSGAGGLPVCNFVDDPGETCDTFDCYQLNDVIAVDLFDNVGYELVNYYGVFSWDDVGYNNTLYEFSPKSEVLTGISAGDLNFDGSLDLFFSSETSGGFAYLTGYSNSQPSFTELLWDTPNNICPGVNVSYQALYEDFEGDSAIVRVDCFGNGDYTNWSDSSSSPVIDCYYSTAGEYNTNVQLTDLANQPLGNVDAKNHNAIVTVTNCFTKGQSDSSTCTSSDCEIIEGAVGTGTSDEFGFNASFGTIDEVNNYQSTNYDLSSCSDWNGFYYVLRPFCPVWNVFEGSLSKLVSWLFPNILYIIGLIILILILSVGRGNKG